MADKVEIVPACRDRYEVHPQSLYDMNAAIGTPARPVTLIQGLTGVRTMGHEDSLYRFRTSEQFQEFPVTGNRLRIGGLKRRQAFVEYKMGQVDIKKS